MELAKIDEEVSLLKGMTRGSLLEATKSETKALSNFPSGKREVDSELVQGYLILIIDRKTTADNYHNEQLSPVSSL